MFVFILCLVMSLSMLSCSNDDANGVGQSQDDFRLVHLNFSSQSNLSMGATPLDIVQESNFKLYFFDLNASSQGKLVYVVDKSDVEVTPNGDKLRIGVKVPTQLVHGNMYVSMLLNHTANNETKGMTIETFNAQQIFSMNGKADEKDLPMWAGRQFNVDVATDLKLSLIRGYARVNLSVEEQAPEALFKVEYIESVRVYFSRAFGFVAPNLAHLDIENNRVTGPSISPFTQTMFNLGSGKSTNDREIAMEYPLLYSWDAPVKAVENEIFLPEVDAEDATYGNMVCLVIGLRMEGMEKTRYYRVDFVDYKSTAEDKPYHSILRNSSYNVMLRGFLEDGEDTPEEALEKRGKAIVDIIPWEDYDIPVAILDSFFFKIPDSDKILAPYSATSACKIRFETNLPLEVITKNIKVEFKEDNAPVRFKFVFINRDKTIYIYPTKDNTETDKFLSNYMMVTILNQKLSVKVTQVPYGYDLSQN